jgi:hypothetical protein
MKRRLLLLISSLLVCLCLSACDNDYDHIDIYNKSGSFWDDVSIDLPEGYFYDKHEKYTIDDDTVAVIIYFNAQDKDDGWNTQLELNSEKEQDNDRCN